MSLDADTIVDRRRMRRKLTFWRVTAVLATILAVVAVAAVSMRSSDWVGFGRGYIARVKISGLIRGDQERVEALDRLAKSSARAVIVRMDSPGGTTAGAEQLYNALLRLRERKPTVIVVDGLAASGGYLASLAGDRIIAQSSSLIGSIGVLFQYPNVTELLNTIGVQVESVKSSPLKAAPSGYEPTSPEARAALASIVSDSYDWFRNLVKEARHLDAATLETVADGRVFTGRQAIELKLVDQLGNEQTAIDWLAARHACKPDGSNAGSCITTQTRVRDFNIRSRLSDLSFLHLGAVVVLDALGLRSVAQRIEESGALRAVDSLSLDGLLALWHPPVSD